MPTTTQGSSQGQRGRGPTWGGTSPKQSGTFFPTSSSLQSANDKGSVGPSPLCPRGTRASAGVVSRSPPLQGDSNPELSKCTCWDLSLMAYPLPG